MAVTRRIVGMGRAVPVSKALEVAPVQSAKARVADYVTVLTTTGGDRDRILAKRFEGWGKPPVTYDKATWFSTELVPVSSIHDLYTLLQVLEGLEHTCVIRGKPRPGTDLQRCRRTSTGPGESASYEDTARLWVMLDVDHADVEGDLSDIDGSARQLIKEVLPDYFHDVTCVVQLSSSAGTGLKGGFPCHLWFWLDRPVGKRELEEFAQRTNERIGKRTPDGKQLVNVIDPAVFRSVQPHYTAAPLFQGCLNPLHGMPRTVLVQGSTDRVTWPRTNADAIHAAAEQLITVWPETGRHVAQLALAGALLRDGWNEDDVVDFLCEICAGVGDEDRAKREVTVSRTRAQLDSGQHVTGWRTLADALGAPAIVADVRGLLQAKSDWHRLLTYNDKGLLVASDANLATVFQHDPDWSSSLWWNVREQNAFLRTEPPAPISWEGVPRPIVDSDGLAVAQWLQQRYKLQVPYDRVVKLLLKVSERQKYDPFRDHLEALTWDGVPRLDTWLTDHLGVVDTPYARFVGRKWLISAVARTYRPGCKADYVLNLEGGQRKGKSSALKALVFDREEWFTDHVGDLGTNDAERALWGPVVAEMAELASLGRSDVETAKGFITRTHSDFVQKWELTKSKRPRMCVIAGTTNHLSEYLSDPTGNGRFWCVLCDVVRPIDVPLLRENRSQLWAEAVQVFKAWEGRGARLEECLWWPTEEEFELARPEQEARGQAPAWEEPIARALRYGAGRRGGLPAGANDPPPIEAGCSEVTTTQLLVHALDLRDRRRNYFAEVAIVMQRLGWCRKLVGPDRVGGYASPTGKGLQKVQ